MVSKSTGLSLGGAGVQDTPELTHNYIVDMLEELSGMANTHKLGALARVLELAGDAAREMKL